MSLKEFSAHNNYVKLTNRLLSTHSGIAMTNTYENTNSKSQGLSGFLAG